MDINLVLFKKNGTTKTFPLPASVTVVGRQQQCDLCIPLMVISRKHCEINADGGVLRVRDLGSRNGTLVNGKKIADAVLNPGDSFQIGPLSFGVQVDGVPAEVIPPEPAVSTPSPEPEYHPGDGIGDLAEVDDIQAMGQVGTVGDDDILEIMEAFAENADEDEPSS